MTIKPSQLAELPRPLAFISGCFDLPHAGHMHFLNSARALLPAEAKLLVVTHADEQIRRKKGENRPVFTAAERCTVLNSLSTVDYTMVWPGWEDILELVLELRPQYLITTSDNRNLQNWPDNWEAIASRIGAELLFVDRQPGLRSTTAIIAGLPSAKID